MIDDPDADAIRKGLRSVLNSRGTGAKHALAKSSAARTLARLQGDRPEPPARPRPENAEQEMAMIVTVFCPDYRKLRDEPQQDPMRDLEGHEQLRLAGKPRSLDPLVWSWLPYAPGDVDLAERTIMDAAKRLGLERGPFALPGADYEA